MLKPSGFTHFGEFSFQLGIIMLSLGARLAPRTNVMRSADNKPRP